MQQAFGTPDADDPHPQGISPVHDAKWRMDEFPQEGLIEFGHYPTHVWMIGQGFDTLEYFIHQSCTNLGGSLLHVPSLYLLKIAERGFSDADCHPGHRGAI